MLESKVRRGGEWLDVVAPGWVEWIDMDKLNLANPHFCVLGQLFGSFFASIHVFGVTYTDLVGMGFMALRVDAPLSTPILTKQYYQRQYAAMTSAWKDYISERRREAIAPGVVESEQRELVLV